MKKTIISVAVLAALASGSAIACQGPSCGNINSGIVTVTGTNVSSSGNGLAVMESGVSASNVTGATYDTGRNASAATEAYSSGQTASYSRGLELGNASGVTFGVAGQYGSASANAYDSSGWYYCPYNAAYATAGAGSEVHQASGAGTVVWGNGIAVMESGAGAFNASEAKADADLYVRPYWSHRGPKAVLDADASASSVGGTETYAGGLVLGEAAGAAGGIAGQQGWAGASAEAKDGYRWNGGIYQRASADVNAGVGSHSAAGVAGIGFFIGGAESGSLVGVGGAVDSTVIVGDCVAYSDVQNASSGIAQTYAHDGHWGIGLSGAGAGAGGSVSAYGSTEVNTTDVRSIYGYGRPN